MRNPTHTIPSLSGTLAKRTKPTPYQILPKSLPARPTPALGEQYIVANLTDILTKDKNSRVGKGESHP
jgi:hypothetical protein